MHALGTYEDVFAPLINNDKSHFMIPSCALDVDGNRIRDITSFC